MICDAITATQEDIWGVVANDGEVIYSRYRHDYRTSKDGSVMIDGGRDYTKTGFNTDKWREDLNPTLIKMRIIKDKLMIVE
jgi:hypothetical protein